MTDDNGPRAHPLPLPPFTGRGAQCRGLHSDIAHRHPFSADPRAVRTKRWGFRLLAPGVVLTSLVQDSACAHPRASTTTDAQGRFALPATTHRLRWILITDHHLVSIFRVCIGDTDTLRVAYQAQRGLRLRGATPDPSTLVLNCVQAPPAQPQDSTQVRCTRRATGLTALGNAATRPKGLSSTSDRARPHLRKARPAEQPPPLHASA